MNNYPNEDKKSDPEKVEKPLITRNGQHNVERVDTFGDLVRRWFVLSIFVLYSASNAFQWTQLVIITSILENYYQVSTIAVSWTSIIYMVTYIPLIFPAAWFLQEQGLRRSVLLGSFGTCIGSWIKVLATSRETFWLLFIGQTIVACSQIFILGIPPQLASTWFPANQVSTACAVGVFGNQLGIALGFVIPATVVQSDTSKLQEIGNDLFWMFVVVAIVTTIIVVVALVGFADRPRVPPSRAQEVMELNRETDENQNHHEFICSIKRLFRNVNFLLLLITYGLNVGVFYAISTLLNTVVVRHFENAEADAGRIGLMIVLCGMAGSMVCGIILDKTHAYKTTTWLVYLFSFVGMVVYTVTFVSGYIEVVYFTASLLGFFMTGYLPLGFEFAAEITFPESEGTSSGLLNASAQVFGIICTIVTETFLSSYEDDRIANGCLAGVLLVGTVLTALIKKDYRRQRAARAAAHLKLDLSTLDLTNPAAAEQLNRAIDEEARMEDELKEDASTLRDAIHLRHEEN